MPRRRRKIAGWFISLGIVCLATGIVWQTAFADDGCATGQAAFNQVAMGMTQEEVETIVGAPPGDYSTCYRPTFEKFSWVYKLIVADGEWTSGSNSLYSYAVKRRGSEHFQELHMSRWLSDKGDLMVGFDDRNRVRLKAWKTVRRGEQKPAGEIQKPAVRADGSTPGGRDVLAHCGFTHSGPDSTFGLAFP